MKRLACTLALVASASAHASLTGNEYLQIVRTDRAGARLYASGMLDTMALAENITAKYASNQSKVGTICIPDKVEPDQLVDMITNELTQHPEGRHGLVAVTAWFAAAKAWPCK